MAKTGRRPRRTEQGYVRSALTILRRNGVRAAWEAPLLGRSVDLVFLHNDQLHTVEFKKHDWRRALVQANDHLLGADFSYICVAEREPTESLLDEARAAGIGVLRPLTGNEWPFEIISEAQPSRQTWTVARDRLRDYIMGF